MSEELTDRLVRELPAPEKGNRITYDSAVPGLGVRVTKASAAVGELEVLRQMARCLDRVMHAPAGNP